MGLYDLVKFRTDLSLSFENDGYKLTSEMQKKYKKSKHTIQDGQIKSASQRWCKNVSIFDVSGYKIAWGDIGPKDVKDLLGVYYVLSEHTSFWKPDFKAIKVNGLKDPFSCSQFRHLCPAVEPILFDIKYVKKNAIARIIDGKIQTSKNLIFCHYQ